MTDIAVSVFRLENNRGYVVPDINTRYLEKDTGLEWWITCGGTRAYLLRFGLLLGDNIEEQAADSHFMVKRVTSALLLAGAGLFHPRAMGRIVFRRVAGEIAWTVHFDRPDPQSPEPPDEILSRFYNWYKALCDHTVLRRAADDAHLALSFPHEAIVYVYRGFEWLVAGAGMTWEGLAKALGVPVSEIRELKKLANVDTGVRHASRSGGKMRAEPRTYATWVCGLIDGINAARAKVEPGFTVMRPKEVADAVLRAAPRVPYE